MNFRTLLSTSCLVVFLAANPVGARQDNISEEEQNNRFLSVFDAFFGGKGATDGGRSSPGFGSPPTNPDFFPGFGGMSMPPFPVPSTPAPQLSTPRPTPRPTYRPTPNPTEYKPTPHPTKGPTTPRPTTGPTPRPTPGPTPYPTVFPTGHPTAFPTDQPTAYPTPFPTIAPTPSPTISPSAAPSSSPSARPSSSPSASPSSSPSSAPSPSPTEAPSPQPSSQPSRSSQPSAQPSLSSEPSAQPSLSSAPSQEPSLSAEPSLAPSVSVEPSFQPSVSLAPSHQPTGLIFFDDTITDLEIILDGIRNLQGFQNQRAWESVTSEFYEQYFRDFSTGVLGFEVVDIKIAETNGRKLLEEGQDKEGRDLQGLPIPPLPSADVSVRYDLRIRYRLIDPTLTSQDLAILPFCTASDRRVYIRQLQESINPLLQRVDDVSTITGNRDLPACPAIETASPTARVTAAPTGETVFSETLENIQITLFGISRLRGFRNRRDWEFTTEEYVREFFAEEDDLGILDFTVDIELRSVTDFLPRADNTTNATSPIVDVAGGDDRKLQLFNDGNVVLTFDQTVSYRLVDPSVTPGDVVILPFCDDGDRDDYVDVLQDSPNFLLNEVTDASPVSGPGLPECP